MAKYFRSKKRLIHGTIIKYLFVLLLSIMFVRFFIYTLTKVKPTDYLSTGTIIASYYSDIRANTINRPLVLLNYQGNKIDDTPVTIPVIKEKIDNKKVYIYSTHQQESYGTGKTIVDASKLLKEELEKHSIEVTLELSSIQDFLNVNNYTHGYSYVASRYFIKDEIRTGKYDLIIDLHRDAVSKDKSTITINGKKYARIMFVIGKRNSNYKENNRLASELNEIIIKQYPNLSRGILVQSGSSVNGLYNQDLSNNMILLELGGNKNTYEEVRNTIELIVPLIGEYLHE